MVAIQSPPYGIKFHDVVECINIEIRCQQLMLTS